MYKNDKYIKTHFNPKERNPNYLYNISYAHRFYILVEFYFLHNIYSLVKTSIKNAFIYLLLFM